MTRIRKNETTIVSVIEDENIMLDDVDEDVEEESYATEPQEEQIRTLITGVQGVDTISTDDIFEDDDNVPSPNDYLSVPRGVSLVDPVRMYLR